MNAKTKQKQTLPQKWQFQEPELRQKLVKESLKIFTEVLHIGLLSLHRVHAYELTLFCQ
jgi:hypothetical protein